MQMTKVFVSKNAQETFLILPSVTEYQKWKFEVCFWTSEKDFICNAELEKNILSFTFVLYDLLASVYDC